MNRLFWELVQAGRARVVLQWTEVNVGFSVLGKRETVSFNGAQGREAASGGLGWI